MLVIARASLRAVTIAIVLAVAIGCDDARQPAKRPGQHWSHPVGNRPQPKSQRESPHQRHFKKRHDRSTPPNPGRREPRAPDADATVRSEGELDTAAPPDAGAKQETHAPDAAVEVFVP
jgi:hypothetical protein